jgi:RNA polymerase sigma-B factor
MEATSLRGQSVDALLSEYARTKNAKVRDAIIERHETLVRSLAHKFARPGVQVDDLAQSAWVALIRALDRFDPSHGTQFSTYAVTCMVGEIKRYFRDHTWSLKVPRHLQEIAANLNRMQDRLYTQLQREPTIGEMAVAFKVSEEELLEAMEMYRAYQPFGLDDRHEMGDGNDSMTIGEMHGGPDQDMEQLVESAPLNAAIDTLDERKQRIIRRRFLQGFSQQQVADELGLSQMHISRLERAALQQLRSAMSTVEA